MLVINRIKLWNKHLNALINGDHFNTNTALEIDKSLIPTGVSVGLWQYCMQSTNTDREIGISRRHSAPATTPTTGNTSHFSRSTPTPAWFQVRCWIPVLVFPKHQHRDPTPHLKLPHGYCLACIDACNKCLACNIQIDNYFLLCELSVLYLSMQTHIQQHLCG